MTRSALIAAVAASTLALAAGAPHAQGGGEAGGFVRITPPQVRWVDAPGGHGAQFATVLGDPGKPGLYVIRGKFPPHVMDSPHAHSQDRYVTVLQGTWFTGTGPVFDPGKAVPLGPGSVMFHPAGGVHWDGSGSDETVIVQIVGIGPVSTTQVDPKAAQWIVVKR